MARRDSLILAGLLWLSGGPLLAGDFAGRVLDPDGKPAAGAEVFVVAFQAQRQPAAFGPARSDAQGRWRLREPRADRFLLAVGLTADALGQAVPERQGLVIRLQPTVPCEGKVIDPRGRPVAGATVRLVEMYGGQTLRLQFYLLARFPAGPLMSRFSTTSGPDGAWRLSHTFPGTQVMLEVSRDGYLPANGYAVPGQVRPVLLWREANVRGRVVDARGKPLSGVRVEAGATGGQAITGKDGSYQFGPVRAGMLTLTAWPLDGALAPASLSGVYAAGGEVTRLPDLVLTPGTLLHVRLFDSASGTPVGPAMVMVLGEGFRTYVTVGTNGVGQIRLPPLKGYVMLLNVPGNYTPQQYRRDAGGSVPLELKPGEREHAVVLQAGRRRDVRGVVLDDQDRPVAGAVVQAPTDRSGRVVTDAHGKFLVRGIPSYGTPWQITVEGMGIRGDDAFELPDVAILKQPAVVRVKSAPAEPLTGRVTDPWGHGLADVVVTLSWWL
ncbi:MAG: carboxypeptidase regulatory-like domain-containing protein, partial [Armatimonadetes bacterium]|nr:carboxypeptidase regulatory-like domain-containing protein [Armatimonadota bacterium]